MFGIVNAKQAQALLKKGVVVIDVRAPEEWAREHIPGARLMSLTTLRNAAPEELPKEGVLFVCARGLRSQTAARLALDAGVRGVYSLAGGTHAWAEAGLPIANELSVAV